MKISIFWFRRDLRLEDNIGLYNALNSNYPVLPIFIFDDNILCELPKDDARVTFIHQQLKKINDALLSQKSSILILKGSPIEVWKKLIDDYEIAEVYTNKDYEPYAIKRDDDIEKLLTENNILFKKFKDQVIFEENEILKNDGAPYTIYTPYKNKWLEKFKTTSYHPLKSEELHHYFSQQYSFPSIEEIGFKKSIIEVKIINVNHVNDYAEIRDYPALDQTSYLSPHLRFGTISVRQIIEKTIGKSDVFLSELIWREFFMQILFHFPQVVNKSFKEKYDKIDWRNNDAEFKLWCEGKTGYPMVDAGMRQLNQTGYMHNRVRMVVASFLCKHLLIDWRWGEAYFAKKLLDYDLAANNGNWQWAAGTGCDAAPYFRVFNPTEQLKKFDSDLKYIKRWIPEFESLSYPLPMVEHKMARNRAIETYKKGIS